MRILAFVAAALLLSGCNDEQPTLTAKKEQVNISLQSTGELASSDTVSISPPMIRYTWQHKITFLIPEGTWVEKGQQIVRFDTQQQHEKLRETLNQLATETQKLASKKLDNEAEQESLKLKIAEAKMELKKASEKAKQDGDYAAKNDVKKLLLDLEIAKKSLELANFEYSNHQQLAEVEQEMISANIRRLTSQKNERQQAIKSLTINAPKGGIVVYLPEHDGSKPAEGDNVFFAQKIIELPNLSQMTVKTTIPEQEISRIQLGQQVEIKLDAIPNKVFAGTIESLGQIVRVKSKQEPRKVYDAVVRIESPDPELMRPGMAARLNIIEKQYDDVFVLPHSTVRTENNKHYIEVKTVLSNETKEVEILARQQDGIVVTGQIKAGDEVIL